MSILKDEKFRNSSNGQMLTALLNSSEAEEKSIDIRKKRIGPMLMEDFLILKTTTNCNDLSATYIKLSKELKQPVDIIKTRHNYLKDCNARIIMDTDGSVKSIDYGVRKRTEKLQLKANGKYLDKIMITSEFIAGFFDRDSLSTILAVANVFESLDPQTQRIALWEIIRLNKEAVLEIVDILELKK